MFRVLASAPFVVGSSCGCAVIRTASELGVLATASFQFGSLGRLDVIRTASVFRVEATAFLLRSVGGGGAIVAAAESRLIARQVASGEVGARSRRFAIRTTTEFRRCAIQRLFRCWNFSRSAWQSHSRRNLLNLFHKNLKMFQNLLSTESHPSWKGPVAARSPSEQQPYLVSSQESHSTWSPLPDPLPEPSTSSDPAWHTKQPLFCGPEAAFVDPGQHPYLKVGNVKLFRPEVFEKTPKTAQNLNETSKSTSKSTYSDNLQSTGMSCSSSIADGVVGGGGSVGLGHPSSS